MSFKNPDLTFISKADPLLVLMNKIEPVIHKIEPTVWDRGNSLKSLIVFWACTAITKSVIFNSWDSQRESNEQHLVLSNALNQC